MSICQIKLIHSIYNSESNQHKTKYGLINVFYSFWCRITVQNSAELYCMLSSSCFLLPAGFERLSRFAWCAGQERPPSKFTIEDKTNSEIKFDWLKYTHYVTIKHLRYIPYIQIYTIIQRCLQVLLVQHDITQFETRETA